MPSRSKYVLVIDNLSNSTPTRDIEKEFAYFGKVRFVQKNSRRCALVEFEKSGDCQYAWRKMDGFKMDGRAWKVDYANKDDFRDFGWKWFEFSPSPVRRRSPSPSRSPSPAANGRSPSRSRSP